MENRKDILVDDQNDLVINNGDFLCENSDIQHVDHIITAQPGEYKETPQLGFGVILYLKTHTAETKFKRDLRVQLNFDGYENPKIDLTGGFTNLKIEI